MESAGIIDTTMGKALSAGLLGLAAANAAKKTFTLQDFSNHAITNANDSVYGVNCVITVPSEGDIKENPGLLGMDTFTTNGRTSNAPFIYCDSSEGPKKLFISQLIRKVAEYKEDNGEYVRTGKQFHSDTPLYEELKDLKDAGSILEKVLGKELHVTQNLTGKTARYNNGSIVGLRDFSLACFKKK